MATNKPRGLNEEVKKPFTPNPTTPDVEIQPVINNVDNATTQKNREVTVKDAARKRLGSVYKAEDTYMVMIAPQYAAYFGKTMLVQINGVSVAVPCDGRPYQIPETFAMEVQKRLQHVNNYERKQLNISNIENNAETSPGELTLY